MGQRVARECLERLSKLGRQSPVVTVLGLTFKENVPDTRNSKVVDVIRELCANGAEVQVTDPLAMAEETRHEYSIELAALDALRPADAVILAVPHEPYVSAGWPLITRLLKGGQGVVFDVKSVLDRGQRPDGIDLLRL